MASFALVGDALVLVDPLLPAPGAGLADGEAQAARARADVERALDRLAREATRLEIMITIPYHARSAEELLARYRDALPTTIWGHRAVAKRFLDPATTLHEIEPGRPVGDDALALAIGKPRRFEMPLFFPAHRALAFGDAVIGIDGGLRIYRGGGRLTDPAGHERVFVPTMPAAAAPRRGARAHDSRRPRPARRPQSTQGRPWQPGRGTTSAKD